MFNRHICNYDCESYLDNFFNSLEEGILFTNVAYDENNNDYEFTVLDVNEAFEKMFGASKKNIIGKRVGEAYPNMASKWSEICLQVIGQHKSAESDIHFEIGDKHYKVKLISPKNGNIITFFKDITDQIKADEILKKHFILFENAHDILLYLNSEGGIIDANKTAVNKYGYSYVELLNMNIQQLRHPSMKVYFKEQMKESATNGIVFEGIHIRKDGTSFPVEVSSRSIDVNGDILRIHIIRDITERKKAEEQIRYLANYDALTGISNRGFLMRQFEYILELSAKDNFKFAVMLFDIDKFKTINDVYGHNAGDEVLRAVAQRLTETIGQPNAVGRLGGDEFLVIQSRIEDRDEASALAEKIHKAICKPVRLESCEVNISISLGAAIYPEASMHKEELIHCADTAMYQVKQKGGNSYIIYSND